MKTKLVYVLTCTSEGNFIEQALIAIWSARYHNPDACIVLLTDDKTNSLLVGSRGELLNYVSEKIVIPFEDESASMMFRSRWIKTSVRELIHGDFLFIDCDTVCHYPLKEIDYFDCEIGAVLDSHLEVNEYAPSLFETTQKKIEPFGLNLSALKYYFSSGVIYVKDTDRTRLFYKLWHRYWLDGLEMGVKIDQPSFAKANIDTGYLIKRILDRYNCVIYTQPDFARSSSILHFTAYRNPSWLFTSRVYDLIKTEGIPNWLKPFILNPTETFIPFRYTIYRSTWKELMRHVRRVAYGAKVYGENVDSNYSDMRGLTKWQRRAKFFFKRRMFLPGGFCCVVPAWMSTRVLKSHIPVANICSR